MMEDGLTKDELKMGATAAARGSGAMCTTAPAAAARRWWRKLTPTQRTIAIASLAVAAAVLLLALYTRRMVAQHRRWKILSECSNYEQREVWAQKEDKDDSFAVSMASFLWGELYSYKQDSTGTTEGPRILFLMDIRFAGYWTSSSQSKEGYSMEFAVLPANRAAAELYSFQLTIGQDDNGNVVWFSWDDGADGDVEIDPSVVHLSFSNGATYSIYNDTVFLLSYVFTGYELQVEERSIDLSGVVWTNCTSVKDLFQRNADLAAFDAQWRNNYW
jgi:hypothetical protein